MKIFGIQWQSKMLAGMVGWAIIWNCLLGVGAVRAEVLSVAGEWHYRLDAKKAGEKENWFAKELQADTPETSGTMRLPNTLDTAGISPNKETPTLWRLYRATKYVGPAWYERQIEIPASWQGKRITLFLERVHCGSKAWLDGQPLGAQDSLATPHLYELSGVAPGKHRVTLCINNIDQYQIGGNWAHSVGEDTQVNWNGAIGRLELQASEPVYFEDAQVFPDIAKKQARVVVQIGNVTGQAGKGTLSWRLGGRKGKTTARWEAAGGRAEFSIDLGPKAALWDEFAPSLQELTIKLGAEQRTVRFGLRQFQAQGKQFAVNGHPIILRGTLEQCIYPLTGHPPMEVKEWRRVFCVLKSYGLNFARFHSWCPPEAAFAAADEEGVYLQPEAGAWYQDVGARPATDRWLGDEAQRILKAYGSHPSFCLFTLGNEMGGKMEILSEIVERMKQNDPRRLYAEFSGMSHADPVRKEQFRETDGFQNQTVRTIPDTAATTNDFRAAVELSPLPLTAHELGQVMIFPNVLEIPKYTGVLKPKNYEMIRDQLERRGMLPQAQAFVEATGKLAVLEYKVALEEQFRTPDLGGFSLHCLQDYPGQGMGTVGMVDSFWDSKELITPKAWREFCCETVPLLRFAKRVFTTEETFTAAAEVAHYGPRDLTGIEPTWSACDERGREVAAGHFAKVNIATGGLTSLGKLELPLGNLPAPCTLTVAVTLPGTPYANRWDIHVYPATPAPLPPADVVVVREWGPEAKAALAAGKKVFLQLMPGLYENAFGGQWRAPFWSPPFWGSKNETVGGLFDVKHPAFAQFHTPMYRDFRWQDLACRSVSLSLDAAPPAYRPIGQVIDNHAQNRKIGTLFEAQVGPGRLLVCGFNVWDDLKTRPEARQLARSLYAYMGSETFAPKQTLDEAVLDQVLRKLVEGSSGRLGVRVSKVESEVAGFPAANLTDGNPKTIWRSADAVNAPVYPQEIILELPKPTLLRGCKLVAAWGGRVKGYAIYTREENSSAQRDKVDWIQAARGECNRNDASETVLFAAPRQAVAVKLVLISGVDPTTPYASLAEIELLPVEK